ncbi:MAG: hypothetical protein IPH16_17675 [Haliscomenobacter sp.]|nr:hypothetical protein [Haliscomenobacter sp.]MBK7476899.1 hypothetical protein [Haliscomenobacter sp.]MBK8879958.1 hypothetical protein [Haliscomenobacter sp.]
MESQSFEFAARATQESQWFWGGVALALLSGAGCLFLLLRKGRKENYTLRMLGAMGLFFLFLLSMGSAVFSGLALNRLRPVTASEEGLGCGKWKLAWDQVRNIRIIRSQEKNVLNVVQRNTRILIVEGRDGERLILSESNYSVSGILGAIRQIRPELLEE